MPTDTGVDDGGACILDLAGQSQDFLGGLALWHEVDHGEAENNDEVLADRCAHGLDHLAGETTTVVRGAAPLVRTLVGAGSQELVDEVALGAHDLHAVITSLLGELGGLGVILDLLLHCLFRHLPRAKRSDGRLDCRRGNTPRGVGIAARVEDLQGDLAALFMHCIRDATVRASLALGGHGGAERLDHSGLGRGVAASNHQAGGGAGGEERCLILNIMEAVFQAGVHGTHDHAVLQSGEAEVKRLEQMWVVNHSPRISHPSESMV